MKGVRVSKAARLVRRLNYRYLPSADNSNGGWSLGHGNFDDPVGSGHNLGQPFAWDFGYNNGADPDGTKWGKIYAARAGTVIDVRDGITAVLSSSDPVLGPGNYILVRHADDTISAYDHLKVHSIRVSVGQYVEQGTWIATVGNTGNTSGGVVYLHFECHTWWTVNKVGDPTGDVGGVSIPIHFEDTSHTAWRPVDGDSFGANPLQYRQDGWRYCYRCAGLYFSYQHSSGVCPAGGAHATTGGNYTFTDDASAPGQPNWRYCRKCAGLFFEGNPGSKCPVTTPTNTHDGSTSNNYHVINNVQSDPGQHHWRWCSLCQGMWFGDAATSVCPGNAGGPHSLSASGNYSLALNQEEVQQNWRWCDKCQGLFYAPRRRSLQGRRGALIDGQRQLHSVRRREPSQLHRDAAEQCPDERDGLAGRMALLQQMRASMDGTQLGLALPRGRHPLQQ